MSNTKGKDPIRAEWDAVNKGKPFPVELDWNGHQSAAEARALRGRYQPRAAVEAHMPPG